MFLVGGAILTHGIPSVHHWIEHVANSIENGFLQTITPTLLNGLFGIIAGLVVLLSILLFKRLLSLNKPD
jgi:predicted DNA repair protein MutK